MWAKDRKCLQGCIGFEVTETEKCICCLDQLQFKNGETNLSCQKQTNKNTGGTSQPLVFGAIKEEKCRSVSKAAKISAGYICQNEECRCEIVCGQEGL